MATGSGKTLLMHANILQYQHYLETHGRARELNRIILLTPNEGLSQQHLREFEAAGIEAELFNKDGRGLFAGQAVEILEITKLRDEMGEKTVAVDAFEGNNLVLVDEGHRGASAGGEGAWMRFRNALCEKGFSFEYSATFGQAVKGKPGAHRPLRQEHALRLLVPLLLRRRLRQGLPDPEPRGRQQRRMDAASCISSPACSPSSSSSGCYREQRGGVPAVQHREAAVDLRRRQRDGDAGHAGRVGHRRDPAVPGPLRGQIAPDSIERIDRVLNEGLVTATGKNLFAGRFSVSQHLRPHAGAGLRRDARDALQRAGRRAALHVENLKGATGEVALRLGENEPFGVINVGDDAKLVKLCEEKGLATSASASSRARSSTRSTSRTRRSTC